MTCEHEVKKWNISIIKYILIGIISFVLLHVLPGWAEAGKHNVSKHKKYTQRAPVVRVVKIGATTRVQIPGNYKLDKPEKRVYRSQDFFVTIFSKRFAQGNSAYIEIVPSGKDSFPSDLDFTADLEGKTILLTKMLWGYRGIFAIPVDISPGKKIINLKKTIAGEEIAYTYPLTVRWTRFPVYRGRMDLRKYSDRDYLKDKPELVKKIEDDAVKRSSALSRVGEDLLSASISHPRNFHKITSAFNAKRITSRYVMNGRKKIIKEPTVHQHSGVDLKGGDRDPVFALASGKVVIAEDMYYEGNQTMIDHGNGIITRYMHQSKIIVKEGELVKGGQLIGYCGKTGMVTGPHLHIGLYIRGEYADPLSFLSLPIRE
jgi:murein DD-endopeptidase MepM/ murein hydrolase activator NlpD